MGKMNAESNLDELLPSVNRAIDAVLRRRRRGKDFSDDFRGWVMLKLVEREAAIREQFRGESTLRTYLRVVMDRLYCYDVTSLNGKWRPSKTAARLGRALVQLERLVYRDGYTLGQAISVLQTREGEVHESELREDFVKIPPRRTRFFVGLDSLSELHADERFAADALLRQKEVDNASDRIRETLASVLAELPREDRQILELRFGQGLRISVLSRRLGLPQRTVYGRFHRILRILKMRLEARGICRNSVTAVTDGSFLPRGIESVFRGAAARDLTNTGKRVVSLVDRRADLATRSKRTNEVLHLQFAGQPRQTSRGTYLQPSEVGPQDGRSDPERIGMTDSVVGIEDPGHLRSTYTS